MINPIAVQPLLRIVQEDARALRAKVLSLRNTTAKGFKGYRSGFDQVNKLHVSSFYPILKTVPQVQFEPFIMCERDHLCRSKTVRSFNNRYFLPGGCGIMYVQCSPRNSNPLAMFLPFSYASTIH